MKRVILLRHGATAGNLERRYIGRTDEPLCETGIRQAEALTGMEADRIVASPLLRARMTAALVFPGREIELCPPLRETDFGEFEGKTADELTDNENYVNWIEENCMSPIPGGDSVEGFKDRCCRAFLQVMAASPAGSTTAFVIHGGCIMAILEAFGRPGRDYYSWHLPNGGRFCGIWDEAARTVTVESGENL